MNSLKALLLAATLVVLLCVVTAVAAGLPKLAAPVYPGAAAAVPPDAAEAAAIYVATFGDIKTLDCQGSRSSADFAGRPIDPVDAINADNRVGPWCFLARDPIEKVKAFYDKSNGVMRALHGENGVYGFQAYVERAWGEWDTDEGRSSGFLYSGVSVHALPPPPVRGQTPLPPTYGEGFPEQENYLFYGLFEHLGLFHHSVAWYGPEPGKREVAYLEPLSRKYAHLESAFFQHKGPGLKPVDESLQKHYGDLQAERMQAAMMAPISARQQLAATARPAPTGESAEDAEFNRIMHENPALAKRYVSLTQQVSTLMQQGKFDEADELLDEIDELEQSNPELAALANREQAQSDTLSNAGKAQEDAIEAAGNVQMDKALWGTATEYIEAVDKEDYYTLIVIDNALLNPEKDYTRDRALIDGETTGMVHWNSPAWGISYRQSDLGAATPTSTNEPPAEKEKESVTEKAKGFLKKLKKP